MMDQARGMQLVAAARRGDLAAARRQLDRGIPVDEPEWPWGGESPQALYAAAESRTAGVDMLRLLVEAGANLHHEYVSSVPLFAAVKAGNSDKAHFLIEAGTEPTYVTKGGSTALHHGSLSYELGSAPLVDELLSLGCDPMQLSSYKEACLSNALHVGRLDIAWKYLRIGAIPEVLRWTDLHTALLIGSASDVAKLATPGAVAAANRFWRPEDLCAMANDPEKAVVLKAAGANFNAMNGREDYPIHYAATANAAQMIGWLVEQGADVNQNRDLGAPLHIAAHTRNAEAVSALLELGADPNMETTYGDTPLSNAGTVEIAKLLLDGGADRSSLSSLLANMIEARMVGGARMVIELGADPKGALVGTTALHTAAHNDVIEVVRWLIEAGADVNAEDYDDETALFYCRSIECAQVLLDAGADPNLGEWRTAKEWLTKLDPEFKKIF